MSTNLKSANLKKLIAGLIQGSIVYFGPSFPRWDSILIVLVMLYGFLIVDIGKTGRIYPYAKDVLNTPPINYWWRFLLIYIFWQIGVAFTESRS